MYSDSALSTSLPFFSLAALAASHSPSLRNSSQLFLAASMLGYAKMYTIFCSPARSTEITLRRAMGSSPSSPRGLAGAPAVLPNGPRGSAALLWRAAQGGRPGNAARAAGRGPGRPDAGTGPVGEAADGSAPRGRPTS